MLTVVSGFVILDETVSNCTEQKKRIAESVDIPALLPALKYPDEHGADGEDHG
ncbi:MAG TPA: hypothetical protein VKU60_09420 [Chloroflexota bacterium]|nr:hypothetical protein [Chloroflexota bacterium]